MSNSTQTQNGGAYLKYKTAQDLIDKLAGFEDFCKEKEQPVIIEWLYYYLGLDNDDFAHYTAISDEINDYGSILKEAKNLCKGYLVGNSTTGKWRDAVSIFCLKNNYGYTDSSKVEVDSNITVQFRDDELAD